MKRINNKKVIIPVLGIALAIIMVGISYAVWTYSYNGSKSSISTPEISLELLESTENIITIENALPMSDNEGKSQTDTFDFAVTSKTVKDIDIEYNINIQKLEVDNGYTSLNDNQIKVYLENYSGTQLVAPTLISNLSNYKLYKGIHTHNSTTETVQDKYKLRVWIDGDVDASNWNAETKLQYKFRIWINGGEHVPSAYPEYVYRYGTNVVGLGNSIESVTGTFGGFDYTEDYATLNKTYFLGHKISNTGTVERNDACFVRNNTLYCLKGVETANAGYSTENPAPYYQENYNTLLEAFGPNAIENNVCSVGESYIYCAASGLGAAADMDGGVGADDDSARCYADYDGISVCLEE